MPLAIEPGKRYPIVLKADADKTPRPTFWARHLSSREWMEVSPIGEAADNAADLVEHLTKIFGALFLVLCGWDNVADRAGNPLPFEERYFPDALNPWEARNLLWECLQAQRLGHEDAKKSDLPSPSGTASTVEDTAGPAHAGTARPTPNP